MLVLASMPVTDEDDDVASAWRRRLLVANFLALPIQAKLLLPRLVKCLIFCWHLGLCKCKDEHDVRLDGC